MKINCELNTLCELLQTVNENTPSFTILTQIFQTTFLLHEDFFLLHLLLRYLRAIQKRLGQEKRLSYVLKKFSLKSFCSCWLLFFVLMSLMHLRMMMMISSQRCGRIYLVENSPGITKMGKSIWYLSWEDGGAKFHLVLNFLVCTRLSLRSLSMLKFSLSLANYIL